jgi:hypothetical protein
MDMAAMPMQWRRNLKPDESVVALTQAVDEAAGRGQVRCLAIVTINPMLEVEFVCAGELDEVRKTLLVGGLARLIRKISE